MRKMLISLAAVATLSTLTVGCASVEPRVFAYPSMTQQQTPQQYHQAVPGYQQMPVYQQAPPPPPPPPMQVAPYQPTQVYPYPTTAYQPAPQQYPVRDPMQDEIVCRQWAYSQVGTTPDRAALSSGAGGTIGGAAVGAGVGALLGAITGGKVGKFAGVGAVIGGVGGGLSSANRAYEMTTYNLENAYGACMAGRGYSVR